jgi:ABC-type phosphate transport system substrate-binding protein
MNSDPKYVAQLGNSGVADFVVGTPWTIGYVDLEDAVQRHLSIAQMRNLAGTIVSPGQASLTATVLELGSQFSPLGYASLVDALSEKTWYSSC